jgi:dihydropyrimidine dehydrogenase (NAD+) subunit PreT
MGAKAVWPLPADRLERRFGDKKTAFDATEALGEANRCLYCFHAPCITACPTAIDIPSFIRKIATGNLKGSARTILKSNLLGASCAVVCPVEVLCEGACVENDLGGRPIEIGRLQRYAMDRARSPSLLERKPPTGKRVALVGAGPASLACGGALALAGHTAVLFEKELFAGGLNMTGVAPYKLRAEGCLSEVEFIRELGCEIRTGVAVGEGGISPGELLESFDAVFLGIGLGDDSLRGVEGSDSGRVMGALEWIRRMKLDSRALLDGVSSAVVVGGGNTALDAAQELASLGVSTVTLVYRREERQMPGYRHEWEGARKLGVRLAEQAVVGAIRTGEDGSVSSVVLHRTADGKSTGEPLYETPCHLVLVATGQERLQSLAESFEGVRCDEKGRIVADPESLVTGNPRVFAGGDAYNGGKEVVNAAAEGQRAARAIDRLLRD